MSKSWGPLSLTQVSIYLLWILGILLFGLFVELMGFQFYRNSCWEDCYNSRAQTSSRRVFWFVGRQDSMVNCLIKLFVICFLWCLKLCLTCKPIWFALRSLVWGHFCLCYVGQKLTNEKAYIRNFGIKDGDQVCATFSFWKYQIC